MRLVAAAVLFIFDFQYHEPIKAKLLICWKTRKQTNQPNNLSDTNFRLVLSHDEVDLETYYAFLKQHLIFRPETYRSQYFLGKIHADSN